MKVFRGLLIAAAALCAAAPAQADFLFTNGAGQTAFDFTCFASKHCFATVITNSAGTEIMTSSNPGSVAGIGTAGASAGGVLTVQGVASMTPFLAAQSGTWTVQQGTPPWSVSQSGAWTVGQTGTWTVQQGTPPWSVSQSGAWTVNPTTAASWGIGSSTQNTAAVANGHLVLGEFNTSPTTITSGNMSPLQMDSAANLLVNCKTGCTGGGGGATDQAAFTAGSSGFGPAGGVFNDSATLTTGQQGTFRLTTKRAQIIDVDSTGNQLHSDLTAAIPVGTNVIGYTSADPCTQQNVAKVNVPISTASGTTAVVTGVSAKKIYVCSFSLIAATAVSVSLSEGSSSTCGTSSQAGVIGVATSGTAANGMALPANGGLTFGNGGASVAQTATAANYLCLFQSGTAQLAGNLTYVQQ